MFDHFVGLARKGLIIMLIYNMENNIDDKDIATGLVWFTHTKENQSALRKLSYYERLR